MQVFSVNISKFLKTSILKDTCERLLLNFFDSKWKKVEEIIEKTETYPKAIIGDVFRTQ